MAASAVIAPLGKKPSIISICFHRRFRKPLQNDCLADGRLRRHTTRPLEASMKSKTPALPTNAILVPGPGGIQIWQPGSRIVWGPDGTPVIPRPSPDDDAPEAPLSDGGGPTR